VLIDEQQNIKVIDFGFCESCGPTKRLNLFCGTPHYMDPDISAKREYLGQASDIWALGVMLFILNVGKLPFFAEFEADLYRKIRRGRYDLPKTCSLELKDLLEKLLQPVSVKRATAKEILKHKWFET